MYLIALSQCKYQKNEIDRFTNKVSIITNPENVVREMSTAISFALTQEGSKKGM
jgi:hypothetical protein